jgi:hypothetical protein
LTNLNYTQLPQLSEELEYRGLKILAFPCNQFKKQEPGTVQEILEFVNKLDPPMDEKLIFFDKGDNARDVYKFLTNALLNEDGTVDVTWNFGTSCCYRDGCENPCADNPDSNQAYLFRIINKQPNFWLAVLENPLRDTRQMLLHLTIRLTLRYS